LPWCLQENCILWTHTQLANVPPKFSS
jgi:hypothetical protein